MTWERADVKSLVAWDLPSSLELLRAVSAYLVSDGKEGASGARVSRAVLMRALFRLSWGSHHNVALEMSSLPEDFADSIAEFMRNNRSLIENDTENTHDKSTKK